MDAHVYVPLLGGMVLGSVGVVLALWVRERLAKHDPSRLTFHWPRPDLLLVEMRSRATFEQCEALADKLRKHVPEGTEVFVVCIDDRERV